MDFNLPSVDNETESVSELPLSSFVPGDAFGIYSSNVLTDVVTVLTKTFVYDGEKFESSKTDQEFLTPWNYFTANGTEKKQAYIKLSDKVSLFSF